jgi:hypothetical protein
VVLAQGVEVVVGDTSAADQGEADLAVWMGGVVGAWWRSSGFDDVGQAFEVDAAGIDDQGWRSCRISS